MCLFYAFGTIWLSWTRQQKQWVAGRDRDRWNLQEGIFAKAVPSTGKIILFLEVLDISETMFLDLWTSVTSLSYEIYQLTLGRSSKWRGVE